MGVGKLSNFIPWKAILSKVSTREFWIKNKGNWGNIHISQEICCKEVMNIWEPRTRQRPGVHLREDSTEWVPRRNRWSPFLGGLGPHHSGSTSGTMETHHRLCSSRPQFTRRFDDDDRFHAWAVPTLCAIPVRESWSVTFPLLCFYLTFSTCCHSISKWDHAY